VQLLSLPLYAVGQLDRLPAGHLAHFILEAVAEMDLRQVRVNERGSGCPQYPPRMLLALLLYCSTAMPRAFSAPGASNRQRWTACRCG
jgi:transposase